MGEELAIIQREQDKIANTERKKNVAILKQVLEPIEEAMSELTDVIKLSIDKEKEPDKSEYFDKDFNAKILKSLDNVFKVISNFKQSDIKIDLSPITSIATEIKKGNDSITDLVKQLNSGNTTGELFRMITAMIGKQNAFIEKGFSQIDYSEKLDAITNALSNKDSQIERLKIVYQGEYLHEVIPIYKK